VSRPRRRDGVVLADLPDGELVAQAAGGATAVILDPIGGAVLELCDGQRTVDQIAAFVCETLAVPDRARVVGDVARVIEQLLAAGVVEDADPSGAAAPPAEPD